MSRTDEIGLKILTTAEISNMFSRESPYISNMISRESPQFQTGFHMSKKSLHHSKVCPGILDKSGDPNILRVVSAVSGLIEYL